MFQLVQSVRSGELQLVDVPLPSIGANEVLVKVVNSVVSAGTERAVRELASASLVGKARSRPDLVRQVARKARTEGVRSTLAAVQSRLDDLMPLGYSAAGVVVEVGENVAGLRPGSLVATGGQGHAEYQAVAGLLTASVPAGVDSASAAFATIGSIALQGIRLADVGPGSRVCVIGLGLIGQLAVRLASASGLDVVGIDLNPWNVDRTRAAGFTAFVESGDDTTASVMDWSNGRGVDAVLVTAATSSSAPMLRAPSVLRDRGVVVVVGDVGLDLKRTPLYEKEATIRFARSYGPGRYDRVYEDWGVDYPAGFVPFSAQRNMETFLSLVASKRVVVDDLITHRYPLAHATAAYDTIAGKSGPYLGVALDYPDSLTEPSEPVVERPRASGAEPQQGQIRIGMIGAGNFVRATLLPAINASGIGPVVAIASKTGTSARYLADKHGISRVLADADAVINDPMVDLVVVATPHDTHADLVCRALRAGKDVFCEKPLGLTLDELDEVEKAWTESGRSLTVGFNRRHSPSVKHLQTVFGRSGGPLVITYRVNAGALPAKHWYHDRIQGGRIIGEVCHFIDTCDAIVGSSSDDVTAMGSGLVEPILEDNVVVGLHYPDGSVATISYATGGHGSTTKEFVTVLGRGHSATIDNFTRVDVDGKAAKVEASKGHREQFATVRSGPGKPDVAEHVTAACRDTMRVVRLLTSPAVAPPVT
jgi:predicted dehydrogenase/threonine dehydrogenase-like Zn-dependent dehydrogenase